jgi:uncharacterized protein YbjT (DUF2867 family)
MSQSVVTVFGATGAQGGGLARAILADPERRFAVRAVTRRPDSAPARALAQAGAQVVAADLDDAASVHRALRGARAAYCVTNFWEHFSPDRELAQASVMAEAARRADVPHVIWSTLEDTRDYLAADGARMPVLMGRYNVPHFDAKGEANRQFFDRGVPVTLLYTSFYWDNFIHFGMGPKAGDAGELVLALPLGSARMPGIAAADIGGCALGILKRGAATIGTAIGIAGEHLSGEEMAAGLGQALGRTVRYLDLAPQAYRALGFPGAEDLGNMFQFKRDFERSFRARRDPAVARQLWPSLRTFAQWLAAHASEIPLPRS